MGLLPLNGVDRRKWRLFRAARRRTGTSGGPGGPRKDEREIEENFYIYIKEGAVGINKSNLPKGISKALTLKFDVNRSRSFTEKILRVARVRAGVVHSQFIEHETRRSLIGERLHWSAYLRSAVRPPDARQGQSRRIAENRARLLDGKLDRRASRQRNARRIYADNNNH